MDVEFEESSYTARPVQQKASFSLIGMLIRMKVVSTEAAAQKVLLGLAVLLFVLTAWYSFATFVETESRDDEMRRLNPTDAAIINIQSENNQQQP